MTTPIGDAAEEAARSRRGRLRQTRPQSVLPAPVPPAIEPVQNRAEPRRTVPQEETMSPVSAALAAVQHQAAALESDVAANPLAVVIAARHVGKSFSSAECIAIADFVAAVEAEKHAQDGSRARASAAVVAAANGRGTGPQSVMQ